MKQLVAFLVVPFALSLVAGCDRGGSNSGGQQAAETPESHRGRLRPLECNSTCPTPFPSMVRSPRLVIQGVRYQGEPMVVLKNGTSSGISLDGWSICQPPTCQNLSGTVGGGSTIEIPLTEITLSNAGELVVYDSTTASSSDMVAYIIWGEGYDAQMLSAAESAELWIEDPTAGVCEGHGALVATGDVTRYSGWRSVLARCMR